MVRKDESHRQIFGFGSPRDDPTCTPGWSTRKQGKMTNFIANFVRQVTNHSVSCGRTPFILSFNMRHTVEHTRHCWLATQGLALASKLYKALRPQGCSVLVGLRLPSATGISICDEGSSVFALCLLLHPLPFNGTLEGCSW